MINSLTNYKQILVHLKGQQQEKNKFIALIKLIAEEEIDVA